MSYGRDIYIHYYGLLSYVVCELLLLLLQLGREMQCCCVIGFSRSTTLIQGDLNLPLELVIFERF